MPGFGVSTNLDLFEGLLGRYKSPGAEKHIFQLPRAYSTKWEAFYWNRREKFLNQNFWGHKKVYKNGVRFWGMCKKCKFPKQNQKFSADKNPQTLRPTPIDYEGPIWQGWGSLRPWISKKFLPKQSRGALFDPFYPNPCHIDTWYVPYFQVPLEITLSSEIWPPT